MTRVPVPPALLQELAAAFRPEVGGAAGNISHSAPKNEGRVDLAAYLEHYGVNVLKVKDLAGSRLHCLAECLFDPAHNANEAAVGQAADGKLFYQCFHKSCKGRTWAEARETISKGDSLARFVVGSAAPAAAAGKRPGLRVVGGGMPPETSQSSEPPPPEPVTEGFSWSNLGNARRLVALHGADLHYNHLHKKWYVWTGQTWAEDQRGEVVSRAKATVESIYGEAKAQPWESEARGKLFKFALKSESAGEFAGMLKLAQSEPGIPVLPRDFDANPWLFNVANGTLDLLTGELREHRREDLLTCISPVAYDPAAECPQFEKFLFQIMGDNQNLVDFLWLSLGYALTGDCREQCFWIFWGSGANGKGTLVNVIKYILGNYWTNISTETILAKDNTGNQIRSDLAQLDGPRLVTASEIDKGRRLSESLVKSLSGQDSITARRLYGDEFTFTPQFKLFIQSNNKPIIRDLTEGMWRRLKLVPFPMDFKQNPDRELPARLAAESQGILAWLVRGCRNWLQYGNLAEPQEIRDAVQDYRDQMDPLKEFLEAKCLLSAELTATAAELYAAYKSWAEDNLKAKEQLSKRHFGLTLAEKGFRNGKGTAGVRLWRGLGLKTLE
jgi:putative DNA primase/helicase